MSLILKIWRKPLWLLSITVGYVGDHVTFEIAEGYYSVVECGLLGKPRAFLAHVVQRRLGNRAPSAAPATRQLLAQLQHITAERAHLSLAGSVP